MVPAGSFWTFNSSLVNSRRIATLLRWPCWLFFSSLLLGTVWYFRLASDFSFPFSHLCGSSSISVRSRKMLFYTFAVRCFLKQLVPPTFKWMTEELLFILRFLYLSAQLSNEIIASAYWLAPTSRPRSVSFPYGYLPYPRWLLLPFYSFPWQRFSHTQ